MARPGVTFNDVAEAANQLIGQGKNPTIEQIRLILGTGSSTTIANHVREWKENQSNISLLASKENLPEELIALMKGLWQRVLGHAEDAIAAIQQTADVTIADLQAAAEQLDHENKQSRKQYHEVCQERDALTQTKSELEKIVTQHQKEIASIAATNSALVDQVEEKQIRITELGRLHKIAQENLEHFREATRTQKAQDEERYRQQIQTAEGTIKTIQQECNALRDKNINLQNLIENERNEKNHLQIIHDGLVKKLEQVGQQCSAVQKELDKTTHSLTVLQEQYNASEKKLEEFRDSANQLQSQIYMLTERHESIKIESNSLKNKTETLTQEKLKLIQEKAQLQGQLTAFQTIAAGRPK
ncbi:MAG: DNA-binding protein [Gammaproteobacteria bacterium]|nr:DNA-binding protein [Gammaproteobacteria bacterium]